MASAIRAFGFSLSAPGRRADGGNENTGWLLSGVVVPLAQIPGMASVAAFLAADEAASPLNIVGKKGKMTLFKADLATEPPRPIHINIDAIAYIDPFGSATRTNIVLTNGKEVKIVGSSEAVAAQLSELSRQSPVAA
jgi:hypothetical protein